MRFPKKCEKLLYKRHIELAMVVSLCFMIFVFQGWKYFETIPDPALVIPPDLIQVDVIRTIQKPKTPPPARPSIPQESDGPEIPLDATIAQFSDFTLAPPPPPPLPSELTDGPVPFVSVDVKPEPIGGFAAILQHLVYPDIARKAGVEGRVIVKCLVDEHGNVIATEILRSLGNNGCDLAAIDAVKKVKWRPAMQRDRAVKVWVAIPVVFKLK